MKRLSDMEQLRLLISCLLPRPKSISNGGEGIEVPGLNVLIDRVAWAVDNPGSYFPHYLDFVNDDLATVEKVISLCRAVMNAKLPGHKKTMLVSGASKKRYKK